MSAGTRMAVLTGPVPDRQSIWLSLPKRLGSFLHRSALTCLFTLFAFAASLPALAGTIHFGIARTGNELVLTNIGNSSAYFPVAYRLLADGRWEPLPLPAGSQPPGEIAAHARMTVRWPEQAHQSRNDPFAVSTPIMLRFFDQAGAGLGQISFFQQPPIIPPLVKAAYADGRLTLTPPDNAGDGDGIRSSWLLWSQEEGIAPLRGPQSFVHAQPAAQRIEWQKGVERHFALGAGLPAAMLLHETMSGLTLQIVPSGGLQGNEQRAGWLKASGRFFQLAEIVAGMAALALSWLIVSARRQRRKTCSVS